MSKQMTAPLDTMNVPPANATMADDGPAVHTHHTAITRTRLTEGRQQRQRSVINRLTHRNAASVVRERANARVQKGVVVVRRVCDDRLVD